MGRDRDLTVLGKALAAPARSAMVNLLMDGSRRPASELARAAGVGAPAASEHLRVLVDAGVATSQPHGRHRYYALASPEVAAALEALGALTDGPAATGYRLSKEAERLAQARFCYDHLAGRLGIALTDAWLERGWLADPDHLLLTDHGADALTEVGVDVAAAVAVRRPTTRACLDWTERRPHLAGALGAAVGRRFLDAGWVTRRRGTRGLAVTVSGERQLDEEWGIRLAG